MPNVVLYTKGLVKDFVVGGATQHVLKSLDLSIFEGDFTVIMGASGGGKSTLLYALSGMDTPTGGSVFFDGIDIAGLNQDKLAIFRRKNCGFVFQQIYLVESMSVLDNVVICGLLNSKDKKEIAKKAKLLLTSIGLNEGDFKKLPHMLSGGEAQRVGIARGCINDPKILFADEPTGALNSVSATAVLDVLSQMNSLGQSVVMVTHDLNSALRGNRILFLKDGLVEGELALEKYSDTCDKKSRRANLKHFLNEMGW